MNALWIVSQTAAKKNKTSNSNNKNITDIFLSFDVAMVTISLFLLWLLFI